MRIVLVLLGLLLVAGCGNSDQDQPSPQPTGVVPSSKATGTPGSEFLSPIPKESAETLPKCDDVWVVGKTLPADYSGCQIDGGGVDRGATYACTDGGSELIGYNEQFFARLGGPVRAYGDDEAAFSQELFEACNPKQ